MFIVKLKNKNLYYKVFAVERVDEYHTLFLICEKDYFKWVNSNFYEPLPQDKNITGFTTNPENFNSEKAYGSERL